MKIISSLLLALSATCIATLPAYAADSKAASASAQAAHAGIDWRKDNNVDAAFAQAKASNKPLFFTGGQSGARLVIRLRQRFSIVRNSSINHATLFLSIWMATRQARKSLLRSSRCVVIPP